MVTRLIDRAPFAGSETSAYVCGPEVMMRYATRILGERGVSMDRVFVALERNMRCAVGLCGHCQFGPEFVCKDGPIFPFSRIARFFRVPGL